MKQIIKLSEYEQKTGNSPAMTKRLIKEGKLRGWQDGPRGHWLVEYDSNDEVAVLKDLIMRQDQKINALCKHLGVQV